MATIANGRVSPDVWIQLVLLEYGGVQPWEHFCSRQISASYLLIFIIWRRVWEWNNAMQ